MTYDFSNFGLFESTELYEDSNDDYTSVVDADKAKKAENEALKEKILALLTEKGATMVAADIGRHCDNITTQKASAMLRQLVEAGKVNSREVSVKGKGKMKGYSIAK